MEIIERVITAEADATINATNANPDWAAGTYNQDDLVTHIKQIWKCIVTSTTAEPGTDSTQWESQGYANKWRWEDSIIGSNTTNTDTIELTITDPPSLVNGVGFFGLVGDSVNITVTDVTDGVVYNSTQDLTVSEDIENWYDYFFEPYDKIRDTVFIDLPMYFGSGVTVDITIDNTGGTAEVGEIVIGKVSTLGDTILPITTRILDYSTTKKVGDETSINSKSFIKYAEFAISVDAAKMNIIQNRLASYRGIATVYIGDERYKNSIVFGFYKDFNLVFDVYPWATCALQVNGLA